MLGIIVFNLMPGLGRLFVMSIAFAYLAAELGNQLSHEYLLVAWKVYAGLGIFSFFLLLTHNYQRQYIGYRSFRFCLAQQKPLNWAEYILGTVLWWFSWWVIEMKMESEVGNENGEENFAEIVIDAAHYWLVDAWRGIPYEGLPVPKASTYARTLDEVIDSMGDEVARKCAKRG